MPPDFFALSCTYFSPPNCAGPYFIGPFYPRPPIAPGAVPATTLRGSIRRSTAHTRPQPSRSRPPHFGRYALIGHRSGRRKYCCSSITRCRPTRFRRLDHSHSAAARTHACLRTLHSAAAHALTAAGTRTTLRRRTHAHHTLPPHALAHAYHTPPPRTHARTPHAPHFAAARTSTTLDAPRR